MSDLTPEKLERIRADHASHDCSAVSNCHANVELLLTTLDRVEQERDALVHSDKLIQADLKPFVTDCSTPTFQLVRNALESRDRLTAQVRALEVEISACRNVLVTFTKDRPMLHDMAFVLGQEYEATKVDRDAYKHAAEQASGMHLAENIGETLHTLKQENRQLTEEREALQKEITAWEHAADQTIHILTENRASGLSTKET